MVEFPFRQSRQPSESKPAACCCDSRTSDSSQVHELVIGTVTELEESG